MGKEIISVPPSTYWNKLTLPDGTLWDGDESSGFPRSPQLENKQGLEKNHDTELLEPEGIPPRFGFGWGIPNPEV